MHFLTLASLAAGASAFLIPPQIKEDVLIIDKLPVHAQGDRVNIECIGGCRFKHGKGHNAKVENDAQSTILHADIKVDGDRVLFGGKPIWPQQSTEGLTPLSVTVLPAHPEKPHTDAEVLDVGAVVNYEPAVEFVDEHQHMTIHSVTVVVEEVLGKMVDTQAVNVRIAETSQGLALLQSIVYGGAQDMVKDVQDTREKMASSFAQMVNSIRQKIAHKLNELRRKFGMKKGCQKGAGIKKHPKVQGGPAKFNKDGKPHHEHKDGEAHRHHKDGKAHDHKAGKAHHHKDGKAQHVDKDGKVHHHHHQHKQQPQRDSWAIRIYRISANVIFPALIGATIGTIGVLIVRLVQAFAIYLAARRARAYIVLPQDDVEGRADGPPAYENDVKEVLDEKVEA